MYFWNDKYNVLRRRTIKESLTMDVSLNMIENLESLLFLQLEMSLTA